MPAVNRQIFREAINELFKARMGSAGDGLLNDEAFYPYRVGDFGQQFPVILIASQGSERERIQRGGEDWDTNIFLTVEVFVAYAIESVAWTEADAEDALDLIEKTMADIVMDNRSKAQNANVPWDALHYDGRSDARLNVEIGGIEYRREVLTLRARVLHG